MAASKKFAALFATAALVVASHAFALKSDNDQPMDVDADRSKTVNSKTNAVNDPDITDMDGNVVLTQGSIKGHGDHARIYRIPRESGDPNAGKIVRVVLTGKQAHMQQVNDGDCALMTSDANTIDYKPLINLAELTGGVVVVQAGHGEFHGEHMLYNTDTQDMESGDKSSSQGRVHMTMEPKTDKPPPSTNNCGFPPSPTKPAAAKPAPKPSEKPAQKPGAAAPTTPSADTKSGGAR